MYMRRAPARPLRVLALFPAKVSSRRSVTSSLYLMSSLTASWKRLSTWSPDNLCLLMRRSSSEFSGPASSAMFCHLVRAYVHLDSSIRSGSLSAVGHGILRTRGFHAIDRPFPGGTVFLPTHVIFGQYFVDMVVFVKPLESSWKDFVTNRW